MFANRLWNYALEQIFFVSEREVVLGVSRAFFEWSVSVPETPFIYSDAGATFHIMEPMELRARSCPQKTLKFCLSSRVILMLQLMYTKNAQKDLFWEVFMALQRSEK